MTVSHVTVAVSVIRALLPDVWHVKQTVFNNNNNNRKCANVSVIYRIKMF